MSRTKSNTPRRRSHTRTQIRRGRIHRLHGSFLELLGFLALMASIACLINPGIVNHVLGESPAPRNSEDRSTEESNTLPAKARDTPEGLRRESLQPNVLQGRGTESVERSSTSSTLNPTSPSARDTTQNKPGISSGRPLPPLGNFQQSANWTPNTYSLAPRKTSNLWPIR